MSKNYKWRLNTVWYTMFYSCTHMATVGVKGLIVTTNAVLDCRFQPPQLEIRTANLQYWCQVSQKATTVCRHGLTCTLRWRRDGTLVWISHDAAAGVRLPTSIYLITQPMKLIRPPHAQLTSGLLSPATLCFHHQTETCQSPENNRLTDTICVPGGHRSGKQKMDNWT